MKKIIKTKTRKRQRKTHKYKFPGVVLHKSHSKMAMERKPLIIAGISLGAILILALLLVFSSQFVGKAIDFKIKNTIGIQARNNLVSSGEPSL